MIRIENEKDCCGCAACSAACPVGCIKMEEKTLGHLFPHVDIAACISCGFCERACPMLKQHETEPFGKKAYAAYARSPEIRYAGSSGGMFGTFAVKLLDAGYAIYGAAFDRDLKLKCTKAECKEQLRPLMKSKYLQSDLSEKYKEIEAILKSNGKVLFVSTPCQVAALKCFLDEEYNNLITVDFFCHGVPSQRFFDECIEYDQKKLRGKITAFEFRKKKKRGSTPHYFSMQFEKRGKERRCTKLYFYSTFYAAFQKYINLRESCYDCRFAGVERVSDITIGDFHDIDKYVTGINRFDGVSMVIVNSRRGRALWDCCKDELEIWNMELDKLVSDGVCFSGGTARPGQRDGFLQCYEKGPFETLVKRYMNPGKYWKQRIYYSLPKKVREHMKKYMGV